MTAHFHKTMQELMAEAQTVALAEQKEITLAVEAEQPVDLHIAGRGRLLSIYDVQTLLFSHRTVRWIKSNVIPEQRIVIGHIWCYWEYDLRGYLDALRGAPSNMQRGHLNRGNPMRARIDRKVARAVQQRAMDRKPPSVLGAEADAHAAP